MNDVTRLLKSWSEGDAGSQERLFDLVYPELRKMAAARLGVEPFQPTLQTTELVHEAYLRLVDQSGVDWQCRAHFMALAATLIRRILLDRAKSRRRIKRGSGAQPISLDALSVGLEDASSPGLNIDILALDQALVELARFQPMTARIVELRFFGGQSVEETAQILGLGKATVVRKWRFAKAWLAERLEVTA